MQSQSATSSEALTPVRDLSSSADPKDCSPAHVTAPSDHVYYAITHLPVNDVGPKFYLDRLNENFINRNGQNKYQWIRTPKHFMLKDHSKSGSAMWIYKRNLNVVNARNTMLELHSVDYDVEAWFATGFQSFNYVEASTPSYETV